MDLFLWGIYEHGILEGTGAGTVEAFLFLRTEQRGPEIGWHWHVFVRLSGLFLSTKGFVY